ncbi:MAG: D-alanyl-D-alanine carboxypeptidase [Pseudomonadota bacterium]
MAIKPGQPRPDPALSGQTGYALMALRTGEMLDALAPDTTFLPASVTKIPTALYALETLGAEHRFVTRLMANGPIRNGVLEGDLILRGGGDPMLDSDGLGEMAQRAAARGIVRITGRFLVDDTALPVLREIDPGQPVQAAYNPSVGGLNLNFNRVRLEWGGQKGAGLRLEARAKRFSPAVRHVDIAAIDRSGPVFSWEPGPEGGERWTVARSALGRPGGRWLPVRDPAAYAGDVFRSLAGAFGLSLPPAQRIGPALHDGDRVAHQLGSLAGIAPPRAQAESEVARWSSPDLATILRGMLKFSTNLTAEVAGLATTKTRGVAMSDLARSGQEMQSWLSSYCQLEHAPVFANHSGLSGTTTLTPTQTVAMLAAEEAHLPGRLAGLLKAVTLPPARPGGTAPAGFAVAKTGTLAFARGLAGYLVDGSGARYAFAVYATDRAARAQAQLDRDRPRGSRRWLGRARAQERRILSEWLTRLSR